jgi:recombination protein RecR
MSYTPKLISRLIEQLKKLPGVGKKTAERYAYKLLEWPQKDLNHFASTLIEISKSIQKCEECGALKEDSECYFCTTRAGSALMCIVASCKNIYLIEQTKLFKGHYHVLGCLISPLDGKTPTDLPLEKIKERIEKLGIQEVILALDSTLEGDATSLYLYENFCKLGLKVTKLASGVPIGTSLEYIDETTLSQAFYARHSFQ